jgi:response regulator of citrate/malate metabolism
MLPDEPFTMKGLSELTGASLLTVRKAVESLQDKNIVRACGQDPDYKGVGRSPMRYTKINR